MNKKILTTTHPLTPSQRGGAGHPGFTLIETLFAILIFSAALIALMTIAARGISATASAAQTTTASYLAQEGIEVARNMRDSNYANSAAWDAGISACTVAAPCMVSYGSSANAPTLVSCGGSICPPVSRASNGGYVDAAAGTPSEFSRMVYAIPAAIPMNATVGGPNEYEIVSKVAWTSKTIPHIVTLETLLKDWH